MRKPIHGKISRKGDQPTQLKDAEIHRALRVYALVQEIRDLVDQKAVAQKRPKFSKFVREVLQRIKEGERNPK